MTDPVTAAGAAGLVAGEPCVLLKQGEIFLKGRNRQQFERMLHGTSARRCAARGCAPSSCCARGYSCCGWRATA